MNNFLKNLKSLDPLLNALVLSKVKAIQQRHGLSEISADEISERDELEILREYCLVLYREYRTVRRMFIENIHDTRKISDLKERMN